MKPYNWDDCAHCFYECNILQHFFSHYYTVAQLKHDVTTNRQVFAEDDKFIAEIYNYFKDEINALCSEKDARDHCEEKRPTKNAIRKMQLGVALATTANSFYYEYEDLFVLHPKKRIGEIIAHIPTWYSVDYDDMNPGAYKNLADCLAHNYTGADLIASQQEEPGRGRRESNYITDEADAKVFYSHYKKEFKNYAKNNNIELPGPGEGPEAWTGFVNLLFQEKVTRLYVKNRAAIMRAPTVSVSQAVKIYNKARGR